MATGDSSLPKGAEGPRPASELEQEVRDLQRLQEATLRLMRRQGSGGSANEILDAVIEAVGATRGFIWLGGGGEVERRAVASRGADEEFTGGLIGAPGTEAVALAVDGRAVGGLVIGWAPERAVGTRERRLLGRYAALAASLLGENRSEPDLPGGGEWLHRLASLVPAGIYLCDAAGRVTFFNRRAAELWRAEPKLEGEVDRRPPCAKIILAGGEALAEKPMARALRTGAPVRDLELTVERLDGTRFEANLSIDLLRDDRGAVVGAINVFQDVTPRKHAVAALRVKEAQLSFVTDIAPVMLTQCSADERFVLANQAYLERRQLTAEQVIGRPVREVLGDVTYEAVRPHIARVLTGEPAKFEVEVDYPKIGRRIVAGAYAPDRDEQGRVRGWVGALTDVTEQRRAAEELRGTLDALTSHIAILDRRGVILAINRSWRQFAEQNGFNGQNWGIGSNYLEAFAATPTEPCGPEESGTALVQGVRDVMEGRGDLFTREYPCHGPTARRWFVMRVTRYGGGEGLRVVVAHENVTKRKLAEEALRESEARFRTLASHAPVGIFLSDLAGQCSFVNEHWCALAGLKAEAAQGEGWFGAVHPEDRARVEAGWREALVRGVESSAEFRFRRPEGEVCWVSGHAVRFSSGGGVGAGYIGTLVDVTARRGAEEASRRLAAIVEDSDDAILRQDLAGMVQSWNRGAERLFGYTAAEMIGEPITRIIPADRREEDADILARMRRGERLEHFETVRRCKDGRLVEVSIAVSPLRGADGQVVGASKIARDITARKRAEAEVRAQQQIYRAIGESIDYGIWICDAQGRNVYASESFLRLVGLTQAECSEYGWGRVLHPEEIDATMAAWRECVTRGGFWEREHRFKGVDGQWHPVLARGVPIRDGGGRIAYWAGINLDISAFKRTEAALRASEEQLRLVTDNAFVFLARCDRDYRLRFVNRPYAARFGREPDELVGRTIAEVVGERAYAMLRPALEATLAGRRTEFELELPYEGVGPRWMRVVHEPERAPNGEVVGLVAVITDVTSRKEAERAMEIVRDRALAASRAKDDFLAALSHELRTPLNPVLLLASDAALDPTLPDQVREDFAMIRKHVELEARLIDDLLDLTRITRGKLALSRVTLDVHGSLRDTLDTLRADLAEKRLEIAVELHATRTIVHGDAVRLQQVWWNVLKNAVKFTPERGRVAVRTRDDAGGERVVIEINDSGIGMTPAERARAFEAFSQGDHAQAGAPHRFGGVGLGLAISRMLVEMHQGRIEAASDGRDRGTTITVTLPVAGGVTPAGGGAAAEAPGGAGLAESAGEGRRGRILLVEDHDPTRTALAQLLTRRRYVVVAAASLQEARTLAAAGGIDLLISDIGLPDGSGYELMAELRERHGVKGIALSGYGMEHDVARSRAAGFVVHLIKPVTVQALDRALAEVKAGPAGKG